MSIVQFAEDQFAQSEYDIVFCVFDRDQHANYPDAIARISQLDKFRAIPSCPCFEMWIFLHFAYSAAPRNGAGALSAVLNHYPSYAKGMKTVFQELAAKLPDAIANAKRLATENRRTGSTNPATSVHDLVEYLIGLKK